MTEIITKYLRRWDLTAEGAPTVTPTSTIVRVHRDGTPAILKVALLEEEKRGNQLMIWWDGAGAARVLASTEDAILLERGEQGLSLAEIARKGRDSEATRTICTVLRQLHAPRTQAPPPLNALATWFAPLTRVAQTRTGILRTASETASRLLAHQRNIGVLHGDVHHDNVLNFGSRGWLAIDPKGLLGERAFDYANILLNPDQLLATTPGRLARQIAVVADAGNLEPVRLLSWVLAWAGLSAAFSIEDGISACAALTIAEITAAELER